MAPRTRKNTASKQQQSTAAKIVKKAKRNKSDKRKIIHGPMARPIRSVLLQMAEAEDRKNAYGVKRLTHSGMAVVESFVADLIERVSDEASQLAIGRHEPKLKQRRRSDGDAIRSKSVQQKDQQKRRSAPGPSKVSGKKSNVLVNVNDVKTAVRLILPPGNILNIALNEGNRAVLNYKRSIIQAKEAKRERQTKEEDTTHTKAATITKKPQEEEEALLMEEEGALEIADHEESIESEDGKDEEEDSVQDLESVNDKENVAGPSGGSGGGTIVSRKESHQQVKKTLMKKGAVCVGHCC